ncbi:MAG: hypothetical protein HY017_08215 [Betaproteobacteria bacterium]|nr:hypothetical protein [Betaproteobacteria bacterium]
MALVTIRMEGHAQLQWHVRRSTTSGRWIGVCEPMNQVTEADSLDELNSVIEETIQLLLTDLLLDNELEQFLREHGWTANNVPPQVSASDVRFDVPWQLVVENKRDSERRAH